MFAPRAFISMTLVLAVFAVSAFVISGSVYTAFIHTLICAVILQVGYFIGVLYLVRREKRSRGEAHPAEAAAVKAKEGRREGLRADPAPRMPARDN
jgi:exopolysaccharide production repressor protein